MRACPIILHVDDDANDRLLVQIASQRAGLTWDMRTVTDGEAAISYLKGEGAFADRLAHPLPDLVLLDLKLPRKTGFEVLDWMRAQPATKRLPVVILTSSAHEKDITQARQSGALEYFVKPVSVRQLEALLKQIALKWLHPAAACPATP